MNLTRVLGPTIGGVLIITVGVAGAFYLNALSFLAVLGGAGPDALSRAEAAHEHGPACWLTWAAV